MVHINSSGTEGRLFDPIPVAIQRIRDGKFDDCLSTLLLDFENLEVILSIKK